MMGIQPFWCFGLVPCVLALSSLSAHSADDEAGALIDAVEDSVEDWARFASTGDLDTLDETFVKHGPQWQLFRSESLDWDVLVGAEPMRFKLQETDLRSLGSDSATMWAEVQAARVGFRAEVYSWDFDLIKQDGRWMVWAVVQARSLPTGPPNYSITATTATPLTINTQPGWATTATPIPTATGPTESDADSSPGVRLPAISAWIIIITLVGVAMAGYMAPRLDRRRRQ
jgi:hypothetical protein